MVNILNYFNICILSKQALLDQRLTASILKIKIRPVFKLPHSYQGLTVSELPTNSNFYVLDKIANETNKNIVFVASNDLEAQRTFNIISNLKTNYKPLLFPAWDCLPYDRVSPNSQITAIRLNTLYELVNSQNKHILITTSNAILTKILPAKIIKNSKLKLAIGNEYKISELTRFLVANSYLRVEQVNEVGEFSVKGSIVEFFPTDLTNPVRLDFFSDKLESIREFDPLTQLSLNKINHVSLVAAHEIILNQENIDNFRANYRKNFNIDYQNDHLFVPQFFNKYLIKNLLEKQISLPNKVWKQLNISWVLFFVFLGCLNYYVAQSFSTDFWVNFKLFGMLGITLTFTIAQAFWLSRYKNEK